MAFYDRRRKTLSDFDFDFDFDFDPDKTIHFAYLPPPPDGVPGLDPLLLVTETALCTTI